MQMIDIYKRIAEVMQGTPDKPVVIGNVEFWIDAQGPWAGQLSFFPASNRWDAYEMAKCVERICSRYPEVDAMLARLVDEKKTAWQHEEILAGLGKERAHSRFRNAQGVDVRWVYNGDGTMGKPLSA